MIRHVIVRKNGAKKAEDLQHIGPSMELIEEEDRAQRLLEMYVIPDRRDRYEVKRVRVEVLDDDQAE